MIVACCKSHQCAQIEAGGYPANFGNAKILKARIPKTSPLVVFTQLLSSREIVNIVQKTYTTYSPNRKNLLCLSVHLPTYNQKITIADDEA